MIDIKKIRENRPAFKDGAKAKGFDVDIDKLLDIEATLKSQKQQLQEITTEKNNIGKLIPKLDDKEKVIKLHRCKKIRAE